MNIHWKNTCAGFCKREERFEFIENGLRKKAKIGEVLEDRLFCKDMLADISYDEAERQRTSEEAGMVYEFFDKAKRQYENLVKRKEITEERYYNDPPLDIII